MIANIAASQALWPSVFLLLAGIGKVWELPARRRGDDLLSHLVTRRIPLRLALAVVGGLELTVGAMMAGGVGSPFAAASAAAFLGGVALVAALGVRAGWNAGCGCLGAIGDASLGWRTVLRAGLLAAMAAAAASGGEAWYAHIESPLNLAVMLLEASALVWLSPELDPRRRLDQLRRAHIRRCGRWYASARRAQRVLQGSQLWRATEESVLTQCPSEHWRQGCWFFMCFPASYDGASPVTAVFAIPVTGSPDMGAVTFVDERRQRILSTVTPDSSPSEPDLRGPSAAPSPSNPKNDEARKMLSGPVSRTRTD